MKTRSEIEVELFGVPRLLAGTPSLRADGETLAELTAALGARCPSLIGPVIDRDTGWLLPGYTYVVGERFTTDQTCALDALSAVLLVSSAAGG
jgi:hypothetical protein